MLTKSYTYVLPMLSPYIDIRKDIYEDEMNLIEDELLPFGFISSQDEEETSFFDGKDVCNISNDWSSPDEPFL